MERFSEAVFRAEGFRKIDDTTYEAPGELTLLGVTRPFTLPFTLTVDGNEATMNADAGLQRLDFGVGQQAFPQGDTVGLTVRVLVDLVAQRGG